LAIIEEELEALTTNFEDYVLEVSEEREAQINKAMWYQSCIVFIPMMAFMFMMQWLLLLGYDPILVFSSIIVCGITIAYTYDKLKNYYTDSLRGKKVLEMVFRLRRGCSFPEWFVIENVIPIPHTLAKQILKTDDEPKSPTVQEHYYIIEFEDCPYFDKMFLISPCPFEDLLEFNPRTIMYKNFIVNAEVAMLTVVRLKEFRLGPEGIIPVVYPIDSDWEAEHLQSFAGTWSVRKEAVEQADKIVDSYKYLETLDLFKSSEKELASKTKSMKAMEEKAAIMAAELAELALEAEDLGLKSIRKKRRAGYIGWIFELFKSFKFWLIAVVVLVLIAILFFI